MLDRPATRSEPSLHLWISALLRCGVDPQDTIWAPGRWAARGQSAYRGAMTNEPPFGFGFGPADRDPDRDPEREPGPQDPFGLGAGFPGLPGGMPGMPPGGFDMSQLGQMLTQLGQMLSQAQNTGGGPVNYDLAANIAKQRLAGTTSSLTDAQRSAVRDAVRLAELWLDPATTLPGGGDGGRGLVGERVGERQPAHLEAAVRPGRPARVGGVGGGPARGGPRRRGPDAGDARPDGRPRVRQPARRRPGPARGRGAELHGRRRARGTGRHRRAAAGEHREVHRGPRPARQRGDDLPRRPGGGAPAAVRPRRLAAGAAARHGRGVRTGHHRRHAPGSRSWPAASTRRTPARSRRPCARGCSSSRPRRRSRWRSPDWRRCSR